MNQLSQVLFLAFSLLVGVHAKAQSKSNQCVNNQSSAIPNGSDELSCTAESALDELSPPEGACDPNETAEDKKLKAEEKITSSGLAVDPSVGSLVDRYKNWSKQTMSNGGRAILPLDTNDRKEIKEQLEGNKGFGEFTNLVDQALSPEASKNLQKTIDSGNTETLLNLRVGFKDIMRKTEGYPKEDREQIISGYLEKFFGDGFDPKKTRECFTDREAYHLGDTKNSAFPKSIGNQHSTALDGKVSNFSASNLTPEKYMDAGKAFDEIIAEKLNNKTQAASNDYDVIYTKDYRNFESEGKKACPEKKSIGPVNQGSSFADNHYYTKPGSEDYLKEELSEIKSTLDNKGTVKGLVIESSCSKVPNTAEFYKKVDSANGRLGMDTDLTNFENDVFPYIEDQDREEWRQWLVDFRKKIAKNDPDAKFSISFEDLSRLRSLKIASDLMKKEPRLKSNLDQTGEKFTISWEGSSGDGTSGPIYNSSAQQKKRKQMSEAEYKTDYEQKYSSNRYNRLSFVTETMQTPISEDAKGKGYFARDTFLVQCGPVEHPPGYKRPGYSPYRKPKFKGSSSKKVQRRRTPSNGRNSQCRSPGSKGNGFWSSGSMSKWGR